MAVHTAVMNFETLFPLGLWVFEPDWLLDHSQLVNLIVACYPFEEIGAMMYLSTAPHAAGPTEPLQGGSTLPIWLISLYLCGEYHEDIP